EHAPQVYDADGLLTVLTGQLTNEPGELLGGCRREFILLFFNLPVRLAGRYNHAACTAGSQVLGQSLPEPVVLAEDQPVLAWGPLLALFVATLLLPVDGVEEVIQTL